MKTILLLIISIALSSSLMAADILHEGYVYKQNKLSIDLSSFKKSNDPIEKYKIDGDVWEKKLNKDKTLVLKFVEDQLVLSFIIYNQSSFTLSDVFDISYNEENKIILVKGVIEDLKNQTSTIYSNVDKPLDLYKKDAKEIINSLENIFSNDKLLFRTSYIEQLSDKDYRTITKISTCNFKKNTDCVKCDYLNGQKIDTFCTFLEIAHQLN